MNLKEPGSMNTVLRKACALSFSFHPPFLYASLFPLLRLAIPVPVEHFCVWLTNCCVWASTSPRLSQAIRWLCQILWRIESHPFFSFFQSKPPAKLEEMKASQPCTGGKFTGKVSHTSKVGFGASVFYSQSFAIFIGNSVSGRAPKNHAVSSFRI